MRRSLLVLALLCPALGSCRYNFVPLIPGQIEPDLPARVTGAALTRDGERLVLRAQVDGRFTPGYLSVAWFNGSEQIGTDSVYLDGAQRTAEFTLPAPAPGSYRATLSFGGTVLRQVELYEVKP
ncbi:hypothetical protein [Deinococcus radiotolerans]|uniref:Ig-like domain-containing protein n=1 Tax=Deinococcus radiotolerans TaxID=1309407 RepID=A0ABQ2FE01_9DEIO|nr:hypothetical protein [Deinococcus radiotolerans]GGK89065.1 hypothetical protein GCM10010844_04480 [Deinococcus radiotolerans]